MVVKCSTRERWDLKQICVSLSVVRGSSGLAFMEFWLSSPPSAYGRVRHHCIQVDPYILIQRFSLSFPPHTYFYPYFCPFLPLFGVNHSGTLLPFRMWAGLQAAVSRADSQLFCRSPSRCIWVVWLAGSVLQSKHIMSATGSATKPRNPGSFPSSGQSFGNLGDSSMPKEPTGSILNIFWPPISLYF